MKTKKLLPLALLPLGIIPLVTISCSSNETTYFEAEGLMISSKGMVMGYAYHDINSGPLEIKEEYNGIVITSIGIEAFKDEQIEGLILPKTLTKINEGAFQNIISPVANTGETSMPWDLSHLTNLEYIGDWAFAPSLGIKTLNLDLNLSGLTKLTEIGFSAFHRLGLTSVNLKGVNNLKNIAELSFENNKLTSLDLEDCDNLESIGINAFSSNKIKNILWPINNSKIKSIGIAAFGDNELTNLNLNPLTNLEIIDTSAFSNNAITGELNLSTLINLKQIENDAFWSNQISSISWPPINSKLMTIGNEAFAYNAITGELNLSSLINLKIIAKKAFESNQISSIIWPTSSQISSIGIEAFALNNFGANIPQFPPGLTTETNGGISPEQIFTNKVRKIPSTK